MATSRGMGRTASSIGMMEGAFFVSRGDLLQWVNGLLQVNLSKVEQCANGAVYCQIIDACHPNSVAMRKVNWNAKVDHEFIPNYKVLQAAFDKNHIERHMNVDCLIRAKYQDNLEFLQWMKCYWEREGSGRCDYDPLQAREGKAIPPWARSIGSPLPAGSGLQERQAQKENLRPHAGRAVDVGKKAGAIGTLPSAKPGAGVVKAPRLVGAGPASTRHVAGPEGDAAKLEENGRLQGDCGDLKVQVAAQQEELRDLRETLDGLERERNYYFQKLRSVELLCTRLLASENAELTTERVMKDVQEILYAENDDEPGAADGQAAAAEGPPAELQQAP